MITLPCDRWSYRHLPLKYITIHTTEGADSRGWLSDSPASDVSIHYLERDDDEYAIVPEEYAAWHAGRIVGTPTTPYWSGGNPNDESVGIEMEGYASQVVSQTILARTVARIRAIRAEHPDLQLPIVGHFELSPGDRTDPGQANFLLLKATLQDEEEPMTDADFQRIKDIINAAKQEIADELRSGFNTTLPTMIRRPYHGKDPLTGTAPIQDT